MAGFEGVQWASKQMRYLLTNKEFDLLEAGAKVTPVSRSIHYGLFLCFEGIRFYCRETESGQIEAVFLNWDQNLTRLRRGIAFSLSSDQQGWVPSPGEMENVFINLFFRDKSMQTFFEEMADLDAQGYFRPFTLDEDRSIGVTFPAKPSIRAVVCRYDKYLGEPFGGVVVPNLVRASSINGTGCLKLGGNYVISVKAVDAAKKIDPEAASALFLDDKPHLKLEERFITEWDSSCCLFALRDGTVIKIPESNLILPSVTIQGIVAILKDMDVSVEERDFSYGELIERVKSNELISVCSIGTAGVLNRCEKLLLVDEKGKTIATHHPLKGHELFKKLGEARTIYWDIYRGKAKAPAGIKVQRYFL